MEGYNEAAGVSDDYDTDDFMGDSGDEEYDTDDFLADEVCALIKLINGKRSFRTSLRFFGQFCKQRFKCLHNFLQSL